MFKPGDIIICIDNEGINYMNMKKTLKLYQKYTINDINNLISLTYRLDEIEDVYFYAHRFIGVREYRKLKLERINVRKD